VKEVAAEEVSQLPEEIEGKLLNTALEKHEENDSEEGVFPEEYRNLILKKQVE